MVELRRVGSQQLLMTIACGFLVCLSFVFAGQRASADALTYTFSGTFTSYTNSLGQVFPDVDPFHGTFIFDTATNTTTSVDVFTDYFGQGPFEYSTALGATLPLNDGSALEILSIPFSSVSTFDLRFAPALPNGAVLAGIREETGDPAHTGEIFREAASVPIVVAASVPEPKQIGLLLAGLLLISFSLLRNRKRTAGHAARSSSEELSRQALP